MISSYIFSVLSFIVLVTGVLTYKNYKNTKLKYFLFFILYGFLTEVTSYYVGFILKKSTFLIYNIYILISPVFYLLLFNFYIKKYKFFIKLLLIIFLIFYFYNYLFIQNTLHTSQTNAILVGSIFIIIGTIFLFIELLNSDEILIINKLLLFWVSIGVLLFYAGIVPIFVMANVFNYAGMFDYIILLLNVIMYGCFITGFIVSKKEYNV